MTAPAAGSAPAQTDNDRAVVAEADFIAKMVEDAGKGDDAGAGAKPDADAQEKTASGADAGDESAGGGDADAGAADDAVDDEGDDEGEANAAGESGAGSDSDDDSAAADGDDDADDEPGAGITSALERHGAKLTIDDLPEEARPIVRQRLRQMEAPFTRAMQEAKTFRQEKAALVAENKFMRENLVDFVVEELLKDPTKGEAINAKLEEIGGNATNRKAHEIVVKETREKLATEAAGAVEQEAAWQQRPALVERYARKNADAAGVKFEDIEEAIADHVTQHGDITPKDIDRLITTTAKVATSLTRKGKRDGSKQYVTDKLKDRRTAGLKVKPGSGSAPAPGKGKAPSTDAEFLQHAEATLVARGM